ncbi:hypothetical protein JOL79_10835 [Microbispora sp. RL4-1S]|uniref:Uncharacterized protein n=1 Tax=Microbispora oryzae TaxID=2806554 RepID=A0A941AIW3_9ACTN|nr:hypothetical protein [Microbispora oryzae]MBP2704307.1 hypothetical protein [Microbispora oryzae]
MTIALAIAATVVAGCASDGERQDTRPLALKEQVSSIVRSGAGYLVSWAGLLDNPNRWHFGENAVAVVSALDARGKEVVHLEQPLDAVPPGRPLAFAGQVTAEQQPVRVKIDYRPATWRPISRIPSAFLRFPVSDVRTDHLSGNSYLVTGHVGDPFRKRAGGVVVTALLRDAAGKLVGGGSAYVNDIGSEAPRRFVITVDGVTAAVAKTDVMARTWGTTAAPYMDLVAAGAAPAHTVMPTTEPFAKDRGYSPIADRSQ